jgi:hypothetical protein
MEAGYRVAASQGCLLLWEQCIMTEFRLKVKNKGRIMILRAPEGESLGYGKEVTAPGRLVRRAVPGEDVAVSAAV